MKQDDYDFVEAILFYLYLLPQYFFKSELSSKTLGKFQTFQELFTKSPITHHLKEYLVINQFKEVNTLLSRILRYYFTF